MMISSPDNQKIKDMRRLLDDSAFRRRQGRFVVEGPATVRTLMSNHRRPVEIFLCPDYCREDADIELAAERMAVPVTTVSKRCYDRMTDVQTPQGLAAIYDIPDYHPSEIFGKKDALFLCCRGIQDPGNLGTLIRTADAAGATAVFVLPPAVSAFNPKTVRASAGSILNIPVLEMKEDGFLTRIKEAGITLFAAVTRDGTLPEKTAFTRPLCLVMGSEAHGLPPAILKCSRLVTLPMRRGVESLNTAAAGSILLYLASGVVS